MFFSEKAALAIHSNAQGKTLPSPLPHHLKYNILRNNKMKVYNKNMGGGHIEGQNRHVLGPNKSFLIKSLKHPQTTNKQAFEVLSFLKLKYA